MQGAVKQLLSLHGRVTDTVESESEASPLLSVTETAAWLTITVTLGQGKTSSREQRLL